jgi:hypothetical protein
MDTVALRQAFMSFAGEERYRQFIRQLNMTCNSLGRIRYWQEELWGNFVRLHPEYNLDLNALSAAFRLCDVHSQELSLERFDVLDSQMHWDTNYIRARADMFPYATPLGSNLCIPGESLPTKRVEVWCCPSCREADRVWQKQQCGDAGISGKA